MPFNLTTMISRIFKVYGMNIYLLFKCGFRKYGHKGCIVKDGTDGHVDSIILLLNNRNYANRNSEEHFMVRCLTTAM